MCIKNRDLNVYQLQIIAKDKYLEQELLSKLNNDEEIFEKRWLVWKRIFSEI